MWGGGEIPLSTPCTILTTVSRLESERHFHTCCIHLAAQYDFHLARRKKSILFSSDMCLCCCIQHITRCASNHSIVLCRCGGQNCKWGRRHQSERKRARFRSWHLRNSFSCPQPDGRFFVAIRQPVSEGVSPSTVSASIRLHEPVDVQALISRNFIM